MRKKRVTYRGLVYLWALAASFAAYGQSSSLSLARAIFSYHRYGGDPHRIDYLEAARLATDQLITLPDNQTNYELWNLRGDVYSAYVAILRKKSVDLQLDGWLNAYKAAEAYLKAYQLSHRAIEKEELQDKLLHLGEDLHYWAGLALYHEKPEAAYRLTVKTRAVHDLLKKEGKSFLEGDEEIHLTYLQAMAAVIMDKTEEAVPLLETLRQKSYPDPAIYTTLAQLYAEYDPHRAMQVLNTGRELFPYHPDILKATGQLYMSLGKYEQAEKALRSLHLQAPDEPDVTIALVEVLTEHYKTTGNLTLYQRAYQWLSQLLERYPDHYMGRLALARLYYHRALFLRNTNAQEARRFRQLAVAQCRSLEQENPNDVSVLRMLADLYRQEGNRTLAAEFDRRWNTVKQGGLIRKSFFTHR